LNVVSSQQESDFNAVSVYEGAMTASEILNKVAAWVGFNDRMFPGDLGIFQTKISGRVPTNCERQAINGHRPWLICSTDDKTGWKAWIVHQDACI
jgi:hypothetical protein